MTCLHQKLAWLPINCFGLDSCPLIENILVPEVNLFAEHSLQFFFRSVVRIMVHRGSSGKKEKVAQTPKSTRASNRARSERHAPATGHHTSCVVCVVPKCVRAAAYVTGSIARWLTRPANQGPAITRPVKLETHTLRVRVIFREKTGLSRIRKKT